MIQSTSLGYLWRSPSGHLLSPTSASSPLHHVGRLPFNSPSSLSYSQASIVLDKTDEVGLIIRGGSEFSLGIFVTGVHQNSAASKLGLRVGISSPRL